MTSKKQIKLTLIKSTIGRLGTHKNCVRSLGLKRLYHTVVVDDVPTIRGMISKVDYLLNVEEIA